MAKWVVVKDTQDDVSSHFDAQKYDCTGENMTNWGKKLQTVKGVRLMNDRRERMMGTSPESLIEALVIILCIFVWVSKMKFWPEILKINLDLSLNA